MELNRILKCAIVSTVAIGTMFSATAFAQNRTIMELEYDGQKHLYNSPEITLNIDKASLDNSRLNMVPIIISDRTYVPVRDVFETMGATVEWVEENGEVYVAHQGNLLMLQNGSDMALLNGNKIVAEVTPKIVNNRLMVPLRFVSEQLSYKVDWDDIDKVVYIYQNSLQEVENLSPDGFIKDTIEEQENNNSNSSASNGIANDVSDQNIDPMMYPETVVTDILIGQNEFVIKTSSEISRVEKLLLNDNRLIIDILNARLDTPNGIYYVDNVKSIESIRTGQLQLEPEKISRVVFDIVEPVDYSISISEDRKSIIVKLESEEDTISNNVTNIDFSSDGETDFVKIEGASTVNSYILYNPDRMIIDIPSCTIGQPVEQVVTGKYAKNMKVYQHDMNTTRIMLDLKSVSEYGVDYIDGSAIIRLFEPGDETFYYNNHVLTIPKSSGINIDINAIVHNDNYRDLKYTFVLPGDYSKFVTNGIFNINDDYIENIIIQTSNGKTEMTISEKQILAFTITEDTANYYFNAMNPKEKYDKIVLIDPGHGGPWPGTSGNGILEKEITLDVALRLVDLLEKDGRVKPYSTRIGDAAFFNDKSQLGSDLTARANMGNKYADMFLSIHYNSVNSPSANGTETFYSTQNNKKIDGISSQEIANIMQKHLLKTLGLQDRKVKTDNLAVLRTSNIPAVLVEIGFVTNSWDASVIGTEKGRQQTAEALFNGIIEVFETYNPSR